MERQAYQAVGAEGGLLHTCIGKKQGNMPNQDMHPAHAPGVEQDDKMFQAQGIIHIVAPIVRGK